MNTINHSPEIVVYLRGQPKNEQDSVSVRLSLREILGDNLDSRKLEKAIKSAVLSLLRKVKQGQKEAYISVDYECPTCKNSRAIACRHYIDPDSLLNGLRCAQEQNRSLTLRRYRLLVAQNLAHEAAIEVILEPRVILSTK